MRFRWYSVASLAVLALFGCDTQPQIKVNSDDVTHSNQALPDYKTARTVFWQSIYNGKVRSLYCGEVFNSEKRRGYNVEHVFPMSWVTHGLQCGKRKQCRATSDDFNRIEADLHNLYPARVDVNKERSSFRFGNVSGEKREFGRCDFEIDYRARVAEPKEHSRGEVSRAMFYMAYQYKELGLVLFDKQAKLLAEWHRLDPPNADEIRRNDAIEKVQGNRNPFIDKPELLDQLHRDGFFRRR